MEELYSHKILNTNKLDIILNYLLYDTRNKPMLIVTTKPEWFDVFTNNGGLKGRAKVTVRDISKNRGGKLNKEQLGIILEETDSNTTIFFHDILNTFSFYDKGDKRLVNFLMSIMYSYSNHYLINFASEDLNEIMVEGNINRIFKSVGGSLDFINQIRRDDYLLIEQDTESCKFVPGAFKNVGSFIRFCNTKYYDDFQLALSEVKSIIAKTPGMNYSNVYKMGTIYESFYQFNAVKKLAELTNLPYRFVLLTLSISALNVKDKNEYYMDMQFKYYYGTSNDVEEGIYWCNRTRIHDQELIGSDIKPHLIPNKFSSEKPMPLIDWAKFNINDSETIFNLCSNAYGDDRIPENIYRAAGYTDTPPFWKKLMIESHTNPLAVKEKEIVQRCLQIMAYQGVVSPM